MDVSRRSGGLFIVIYFGFKTKITYLQPLQKDNNNTTKRMLKNNCTKLKNLICLKRVKSDVS